MKAVCLALAFSAGLFAQRPFYWDFEGANPLYGWYSWSTPATAGFYASPTTWNCQSGQCLTLISPATPPANSWGAIRYSLSGRSYAGTAVRFKAAARATGVSASSPAYLWVNAGSSSAFAMSQFISSAEWQDYTTEVLVPPDATSIGFGIVAYSGQVWIDNASFTILPSGPMEPARPLSETGLANVTAFARLLGYVRHFHPSDQAAKVDWDQFTIRGIRAVETAETAEALAGKLGQLFSPIAPTVRVFPGGQQPDLPSELQPAAIPSLEIVRWNHHGVGLSSAAPWYHSERQYAAAAGALPEGFQNPAQPYVAPIGRGLYAMVPLSLYADAQGTLPHASYNEPEAELTVPEDRGTRLAGVVLAWNVIQHFYPYFDAVDTDWPAALTRALGTAATDSGAADYLKTLDRLVAAQKDGHGYAWQMVNAPPTYTVPLKWEWVEGQLVVTYNAAGQGPQPGDRVLSIDGRSTADVIAEQKELVSGATPQWILYRVLNNAVQCTSGNQRMQIEFEPYASPGASVAADLPCTNSGVIQPLGDIVRELEPGIMYIDLNRATDADWTAALPRMASANGIIFDLRGYPRTFTEFPYLSQTGVRSEQWHVPTPAKPDRTDLTFQFSDWAVPADQPYLTARRVFLTDGTAVSAAETFMGIVANYKLGEIVGGSTAGTNGNINYNNLPGGFRVSFTGMKVLMQDGSQFHGVGVHPTIPAVRTRAGLAAGRDEVLLRGLEVVKWSAAGSTPAIAPDGIRNAASLAAGAVAPGERVTISGTNLGPATPAEGSYDISGYLSKSAGDVQVFFDDMQAPLVRASATQVTAIVPYKAAASTKVRVAYQGRSSNEVTLPVAAAAPGIFAVDGATRASVTNQDGTVNSESTPAARGEIVTLYATGEGRTAPTLMDAQRPAPGTWPAPAGDLTVDFDGIAAEVLFKGEIEPGVLQLNVRVPASVKPGAAVPISLSVGGASSAGLRTIAVK